MNRTQTWILVLLLIAILECSCTNPNEATDPNVTVWRKKDSPIIVDSLVHVKAGETLRIEKGVTVLLKSSVLPLGVFSDSLSYIFNFDEPKVGMIRVDGRLEAIGSEEEPITMTRSGEGYWGAIYADTSSVLNLIYCNISYSSGIESENLGYFTSASIWFKNSSGSIVRCSFENNEFRSILCENASPIIRRNLFEFGGVITLKDSSPVIDNNIMIGGFMAFSIRGHSSPYIINNTISNYIEGLATYTYDDEVFPVIKNNIFWRIESFFITRPANSYCTFKFNLLSRDGIDYKTDYDSNLVWLNPLLTDEENCNYNLSEDSPMIDVGCTEIEGYEFPEYDFYGNKRISGGKVDIGAAEFINVEANEG